MNKKVRQAILDIMVETPNISKEEVIELIRKYDDAPDVQNLIDKEYKTKAGRIMSTFKDEKGVRDVFAIKNNADLSEYVDITRSKEIEDLKKVKRRLQGNITGNTASLRKVETKMILVGNQQTVFEVKEGVQ